MVKDSVLGEANNRWHWPTTRGPTAAAVCWRQRRRSIMIVDCRRVARRELCVCLVVCSIYLLSLSISTYDRSTKLAVGGWSFAISTESGRSDGLTLQVDFGMKTASARLIMAIPSIYMFHR